jgi:serine protease Do
MSFKAFAIAGVILSVLPVARADQLRVGSSIEGSLSRGDRTLESGEFHDTHTISLRAGQSIRIEMTSTEIDPYLILIQPDEEQIENDDASEGNTTAVIEYTATVAGTYQVVPTTFEPGELGSYSLRITAN